MLGQLGGCVILLLILSTKIRILTVTAVKSVKHRSELEMALPRSKTRKKLRSIIRNSELRVSLLRPEERDVVYNIDEFLRANYDVQTDKNGCWQRCSPYLLDKGMISLLLVFAIILTGIVCLVLSRHVYELSPSHAFDQVSRYVLSMGIFGLLSGLVNALAIVMLFYRIPLVLGSGVIMNNHDKIKEIIKIAVVQIIFDHEFLQNLLVRKARQVSAGRDLSQELIDTLECDEIESVILKHVTRLFSGPEAHLLTVLGVTDKKILAITKPLLLSLFSKIAPILIGGLGDSKEAVSAMRLRQEMCHYLEWRMKKITRDNVSTLMQKLLGPHLGWVIVWGCLLGAVAGAASQALRISLSFNYRTTN